MNYILLQTQYKHRIVEPERGAKIPLKSNCTNTDYVIPSIISHINVHMDILLLQVNKELFVPCHVE